MRTNRDFLRGLYTAIKFRNARFSFLTGVSKLPKASLFSGLNNLITLETAYPFICGYAAANLDGMAGTEAPFSAFDVDETPVEALPFRKAYLTIRDAEERYGRTHYRLAIRTTRRTSI